jgi:hypothetical protein
LTENIVTEDIAAKPPQEPVDTRTDGERARDAWNLRQPAGTAVTIAPTDRVTATRSAAWVFAGDAVVAVVSRRHPVQLALVQAVADELALDGAA